MKRMNYRCIIVLSILFVVSATAFGQEGLKPPPSAEPQKANARPADVPPVPAEPFDGASVEKMASQCVMLHTALGAIEIEMIPEAAPEAVRNFLNLSATGALDTTTFSRTVKGFIIQGGNLSTSEKWSAELAKRMSRTLPDEPGLIAHVRGIVSMARTDEPNSATTHFFILVGEGRHLDSKFAAFGRVKKGIEVADAINQAPAEGEKPVMAVRIERAVVSSCGK
jgi:cyclophilin family peptidyl-prolyl cis-trans isomerase